MADIEYTGDVYTQIMGQQEAPPAARAPEPAPSTFQGAASVLGALASLGLVVGIGVWGYQLVMRDVSGVPVVRALEGPMRVQPDDPGGKQADHQGLAVNAVAADGGVAPTADRLVLAPRPVALLEEDAPIGQIKAQPAPLEPSTTPDQSIETASVDALVEQLTAGVAPISGEESPINPAHRSADEINEATQSETQATDSNTQPAAYQTALNAPGLTRSLRPQSRPARAVVSGGASSDPAALAAAINGAVDTVASIEIDPDTLAVGTRLAQLGAYDSPEIARAEWQKLNVRFEDFMQDKQRVIQKATSGGRTFYRLRALGFTNLSDARRFCSALVSENTDCIPVTVR